MKAIVRAALRLPIRLRLMLGFAAVLICLFGGLALALHQSFSASLDNGIDKSLHTRAADLVTLIRSGEGRDGAGRYPALPESGGAFAQLLGAHGQVLEATRDHGTEPLLGPAEVEKALTAPLLVGRRDDTRLLAEPLRSTPPTVLVVGESLEERDRALGTLSDLLFIGGPALLLLTCVAGYALIGGALHPVERMRARAGMISGTGTGDGAQLPLPPAHDELRRLGETLNEMLRRLERAIDRERTFVAQAGHELRTPLSILKLELELAIAEKPSGDELDEMLRSATDQVERLVRLAESLLLIARGERRDPRANVRPVDVVPFMERVAERFRGPAAEAGRRIVVERGSAPLVTVDPDRLEQALTNMIVNALDHGEGRVVLTASEDDDAVGLHVLDEGDGFDPDFLPVAFEGFARAAPDRTPGRGAGLGLSILATIAVAHGGSYGARNRPEGGADVWISLPRTPAATPIPDTPAPNP